MLTVSVPPQILKRYNFIVKVYLWDGQKSKDWLSKLRSPRDKGGLGLPNLRLYQISFEMVKIAKHWTKYVKLDLVAIEKEVCYPFTPLDRLSQTLHGILNPALLHSRYLDQIT